MLRQRAVNARDDGGDSVFWVADPMFHQLRVTVEIKLNQQKVHFIPYVWAIK